MQSIRDIRTNDVTWEKIKGEKRAFRMSAGEDVLATLRWQKGSLALADTADGRWTFKRSGFLRPRVSIRIADSETDVATFHASWDGGGRLELRDGQEYRWDNTNLLHTAWVWTRATDQPLLRFKGKTMTVEPAGRFVRELAMLASLSWYLNIMAEQDADGSVAGIVAATGP